jgi:hypothetical protein
VAAPAPLNPGERLAAERDAAEQLAAVHARLASDYSSFRRANGKVVDISFINGKTTFCLNSKDSEVHAAIDETGIVPSKKAGSLCDIKIDDRKDRNLEKLSPNALELERREADARFLEGPQKIIIYSADALRFAQTIRERCILMRSVGLWVKGAAQIVREQKASVSASLYQKKKDDGDNPHLSIMANLLRRAESEPDLLVQDDDNDESEQDLTSASAAHSSALEAADDEDDIVRDPKRRRTKKSSADESSVIDLKGD